MRVIFLGTPSFGVPALEKLIEKHDVLAVVCQQDKPASHGKVEFCPVKQCALSHNIPVYQFEKISRDGVETLTALKPDVMITAAYGQILSQQVIDIAPNGILNIHGSLLPELRGAAPIQYAVWQGLKTTGVTVLKTVYKVDAGDILLKKAIDVLPFETSGELYDRLSLLGADAIIEALDLLESGKAVFTPQNEEHATFSHKLTEEDERLCWNTDVVTLINTVRALSPKPGSYTYLNDTMLKIYALRPCDKEYSGVPGEVVDVGKKYLVVMCKDAPVYLTEVQLAGKKRMDIVSFLNGNKVEVGTVLK